MIAYTDFGGHGSSLHFLHANGYPPACYQPLMDLYKNKFRVSAMHLRPLWPGEKPEEIRSWHPFTDELLLFLEEQKINPVIGVGHSMGAIVTLRTALRKPDQFQALVLIDPVLFPPSFIVGRILLNAIGLGYKYHPLITAALKRRRHFDDLDQLFLSYRQKKIFRYLRDDALRAYINGIVKPAKNGGYELVFSPEWEAQIYYSGIWRDLDLWWGLPGLKVPTLIIRGEESDTFLDPIARRIKRICPAINIATIEKSSHLVPLEKPQITFNITQEFLQEIL
jgi:pimeloyl-ACP methyl ester carboxylesterase